MDSYTAVRLRGSPKPTDVTVDGPTLEGTRRATHERGSANGEEVGQEAGEEVAVERERKKGGDSAESAERRRLQKGFQYKSVLIGVDVAPFPSSFA